MYLSSIKTISSINKNHKKSLINLVVYSKVNSPFHVSICTWSRLSCTYADASICFVFVTRVSQDLLHGRIQMKTLTNKWYEEVRQGPSGSEDDDDEAEIL